MAIEVINLRLSQRMQIPPTRMELHPYQVDVNRAFMELQQDRAALTQALQEAQAKINELIEVVNVLSP